MHTFTPGQRITFRESETGPAEAGRIVYAIDPCDRYPRGGCYAVDLDDGSPVEAFWTEMQPAPAGSPA